MTWSAQRATPYLGFSFHMISSIHPHSPRKLLTLDASGAALSALLLGIVSVFPDWLGLPRFVLIGLVLMACLLVAISTAILVLKKHKERPFLRTIAVLNLSYCLITLAGIGRYSAQMTPLAYVYFTGETGIIMLLICWEWQAGKRTDLPK